jgi:hypothetical protein
VRTPIGYPVYLKKYEQERRALAAGLPIEGLYSAGRNAEFAHILMEDIYWNTMDKMRDLRAYVQRET